MPIDVRVNVKQSVAVATVAKMQKTVLDTKAATNQLNRALEATRSFASGAVRGIAGVTREANKLAAAVTKASAAGSKFSAGGASAPGFRLTQQRMEATHRAANNVNSALGVMERRGDRVAAVYDRIQASTAQIAANLGAASAAVPSGGIRVSGGGGGGSPRTPSAKPPRIKPPPSPFDNDPLAGVNYFRQGAKQGIPFATRMFMKYTRQYDALQRGQAMAQNGPQGKMDPAAFAVMQAVMRTRFGRTANGIAGQVLGVDVQRLLKHGKGDALSGLLGNAGGAASAGGGGAAMVGRVAAGAGGIAIPLTLVLAKLYVQFKLLSEAVKMTQVAYREWTSSLVDGGGSLRQAAQATSIEKALGLSPGSLANAGRSVSPTAAAMAGINPIGGPYGDNNYNAKGIALVDYIRKAKNFNDARRRAELAGSPELAKSYLVGQSVADRMKNRGFEPDQRNLEGAANLEANTSLLMDTLHRISAKFGGPVVRAISKGFEVADKVLNRIPWDTLAKPVANAFYVIEQIFTMIDRVLDWLANIGERARKAIGLPVAGGAGRDPLKDNTEAVKANTQAIKEGTYGGGARAAGATPSKLNPVGNSAYRNAAYGMM